MKPTASTSTRSVASWASCWIAGLIFVICALAMTSCSTGTEATRAQPPMAPPAPPSGLQANQRQPCPELPPAASDRASDLLVNHDQVAQLYGQCRARNASLLLALDEWLDTARSWYCAAVDRAGLDASECRRDEAQRKGNE